VTQNDRIIQAAEHMDWMQVVLNQAAPCFHLQRNGYFCGRAQRWVGHDNPNQSHKFVSLADLLKTVRK